MDTMTTDPAPKHTARRWWPHGAVAVAVVAAVVLVWFQPQKLWIDERVDDELPDASVQVDGDGRADAPSATGAAGPRDLRTGQFVSLDHTTSGSVRIVELASGERVVRLENLRTDNGPDLYLYLSTNTAHGARGAFDDDFLSLGRLKGNLGDQNYALPAGTDLDRFASVVIWCDRFNAAFGAAELERA